MPDAILIITLLISLSYISERISNLLKLYLPEKWISSLKSTNKTEEKKREKKILLVTLVSGILTSTLFFISFSNKEINNLISFNFGEGWQFAILILLVGILLSFGSKFWHDVLDIVLSYKKTKQFIVDEKVNKVQVQKEASGLERFKKLSLEEQRQMVHNLIDEQAINLKNQFPEIQGLSVYRKIIYGVKQNYYSLQIDVIKKENDLSENHKIPRFLNYSSDQNIDFTIPTDIIGVGINKLSGFIGDGEMPKKLGLSCSREGVFGSNNSYYPTGTIGLKVYKNGTPYLLSCYHVLCYPELMKGIREFSKTNSSTNQAKVISPSAEDGGGKVIANVVEGELNKYLDVALAELKDDTVLINEFYNNNGTPNGRVDLTSEDTQNETACWLYGRTSGSRESKIMDYYCSESYFDYQIAETNYPERMVGLIKIYKISEGGDSGAAIVNKRNELIGILVGGNDVYSYAIPVNRIFDRLLLDN